MSNRNFSSRHGRRNQSDPGSTRFNTKYNQRGGRNNRPEPNRRPTGGDDVDMLMDSLNRHFSANGSTQYNSQRGGERRPPSGQGRRQTQSAVISNNNQIGWWRITIPKAGNFGKERVLNTIKAHANRQFQPYHYFIDRNSKDGVFFVNSQAEADMLKRANGKIEIQSLETLRIIISRIKAPVPSIDDDIKPFFKDFLLNRRFNKQTYQLDLSNLADDEELSTLGIYPQFNKIAFLRDVIDIINKDLHMTRQLDLGSNNIVHLSEFRNLHLDSLMQMSLASNQIRDIDDFDCLKQFSLLSHLLIKNNPILTTNNKSKDEIISIIQKKLPQLKRIDDLELTPLIRFATDISTVHLPKSIPHCVPDNMKDFLAKFIDEYYRLFDTRGRGELQSCYHDSCILSFCVSCNETSIVTTRQYKYGQLIYYSRNLKKVDEIKQSSLMRSGKAAVLDFLRVKFPITKHEGSSFRVDFLSSTNNRAIFCVSGLFRETEQGPNGPVRHFQRTFTCVQTVNCVLIVADHIMLNNATDQQVLSLNRTEATIATTTQSSTSTASHMNIDTQNQMIMHFSQQSGMNMEFAKLCLLEYNWNYDNAREVFLDLQRQNKIPPEAFVKS